MHPSQRCLLVWKCVNIGNPIFFCSFASLEGMFKCDKSHVRDVVFFLNFVIEVCYGWWLKCHCTELLKTNNLLWKSKAILLLYSLNSFLHDWYHLGSYQKLNRNLHQTGLLSSRAQTCSYYLSSHKLVFVRDWAKEGISVTSCEMLHELSQEQEKV